MFSLQFSAFGEPSSVIKAGQVPKPTLTSDTQVLVRVKASIVHPADLLYIKGTSITFPREC